MAENNVFSITSLRGGLNNTDPAHLLSPDQCTIAKNVEFNLSTLGERRKGCTSVDLPVAITGNANIQAITFVHRHVAGSDETASELWVLGQHLTTQNYVLCRKTTVWETITPVDAIDVTNGYGFRVNAQSLHGKLYIAYRSVGGIDRLHVWDGTSLRRTGLAEPAVPTHTPVAGAGFTGVRYYRVRYITMSGTDVLRRSEPSDTLTYTPAGAASVTLNRPALISEGETHWELEASTDNANFYVLATTLVATTTVSDTTVYATGYSSGTLSADIGDYALIHSVEFLAADQDRLIFGGSFEDTAKSSRFGWTPVFADPTGDGNHERIPDDTDMYFDLDTHEGGGITHISSPVNGYIYATKQSYTYRMSRTGRRANAYDQVKISGKLGALRGSVIEGVDQLGMPCLYFLDPDVGPCRTGGNRIIQNASRDILTTWRTVNLDATVVSRSLFYPESRQAHWWIATDDAEYPNLELVLQTNETRETEDGVRKGWATHTGKKSRALCACVYAENIDAGTARSLVLRPFIGVLAADGYVLRCDTGTTDDGEEYVARIVPRPVIKGLRQKFGVMGATLLATTSSTAHVVISLYRDFETYVADVEKKKAYLSNTTGETSQIFVDFDNLSITGCRALEIEIEDDNTATGQWELNRLDLTAHDEETLPG